MNILTINAGSSSVKYKLIHMPEGCVLSKGVCERVGNDDAFLCFKNAAGHDIRRKEKMADYQAALRTILDTITGYEIHAIGHRVVHGGPVHNGPKHVDIKLIEEIEALGVLAPQHNPPSAACIRACAAVFGEDMPQVAVFDTAFHRTMPPRARIYSIPYEYYENNKIQRYGFHGLSHSYISRRCTELLGRQECRIISCHIGNGCSITAIENGHSVDTTLGYTSLDGVMMGTRCGAIDPAIVLSLQELSEMSDVSEILYHKSGLLGVSGVSNDWRDVSAAAEKGNMRAALAVEMQRYQIVKYIGAYLAAMGGADAIVFTGGIGANDSGLWKYVCNHLCYTGVEIDNTATILNGQEQCLTARTSKIAVYVIPTDEEKVIAEETYAVLQNRL